MNLDACVALVRRADPDRAAAAELAQPEAQKVLWPLYAMNVEVSRAPWVTAEPMIAEMRLQWWRDALVEIADGKAVRSHEVTLALADAIGPDEARRLDALVEARRWDIYKDAFVDEAAFWRYLDDTSGILMGAAATSLGMPTGDLPAVIRFGRAVGLARFFRAVPQLESTGRIPLVDGRAEAIANLAKEALDQMPDLKEPRDVLREGWMAKALLRQVVKSPIRVANGAVGLSEFGKKWRLLIS